MCLGFAYVVPKEAVEKYGKDFFQNPVGTGPFIFVNWTPDLELNLKKNPKYWAKDEFGNQLPYVERVKFRFLKIYHSNCLNLRTEISMNRYRIPTESFKAVVNDR